MKMPPFAFAKANDLPQVFQLWKEAGDDAKLLAGGQTLLATLSFRLSEPSALIDITGVSELQGISEAGSAIRIGALTTHATLASHLLVRTHAPLLTEAAPLIAHAAIRNRGTIGGSLAYADPAAELPACMVALGATIIAASAKGERRIPAGEFFTGLLTTALNDHELIAAIEVPKARVADRFSILEIARRSGDYAMAGLAIAFRSSDDATIEEPRIVFFGVGEAPVRVRQAELALVGQTVSSGSIAAAQSALIQDLDPPADMHGSAALKLQLCRTLLARSFARFPSATKEVA